MKFLPLVLLLLVATTIRGDAQTENLLALEPFNGARFEQAVEGGKTVYRSVPSAGTQDRGGFIEGVTFSTGTIEVDLKGVNQPGGSFLGVVFHAIDGKTYDAVYFRPFNFGHADSAKRGHAVQYMSHPVWPWRRLRSERPEAFENPASPEPGPDEWFHARIVVGEERVQVYIDEASEPCLDVEILGERGAGKVGLWFNGIASFANFEVSEK